MNLIQASVKKSLKTPFCCAFAVIYLAGASFALIFGKLGNMAFFATLAVGNLAAIAATVNRREGHPEMRASESIDI